MQCFVCFIGSSLGSQNPSLWGFGFMDLDNNFFKKGLFEEAKELFTLIYEERNNEHVNQFKLFFHLGTCYQELKQPEKASLFFAKAYKEDMEKAIKKGMKG